MKKLTLLASFILILVGCQTVTHPINSATIKKPANPMLCTMQYDPVCGKVAHSNSVFSYKTYSNACLANTSRDNVISYTDGASTGVGRK